MVHLGRRLRHHVRQPCSGYGRGRLVHLGLKECRWQHQVRQGLHHGWSCPHLSLGWGTGSPKSSASIRLAQQPSWHLRERVSGDGCDQSHQHHHRRGHEGLHSLYLGHLVVHQNRRIQRLRKRVRVGDPDQRWVGRTGCGGGRRAGRERSLEQRDAVVAGASAGQIGSC